MPQITIAKSAHDMADLRPLWESLGRHGTIFQNFHWNLLAFTMFAGREEPFVVCARASYGVAIVPAAVRHSDSSLRLLGEELFDYRSFLHTGDQQVLACALAQLAVLQRPLEVVAVRDQERPAAAGGLPLFPFSAAPAVRGADSTADQFAGAHLRLARNLRRLARLGFELKAYPGNNPPLLRAIYRHKAGQTPGSLFHDALRIQFLVNAALLHPSTFEIFTLESGPRLGAALVTLLDAGWRRFYTGWFDPELEEFSPAAALIFEVTRRSLAAGLDCDYMTGEQPYKLRLATRSIPLYRLLATSQELAALSAATAAPLPAAA